MVFVKGIKKADYIRLGWFLWRQCNAPGAGKILAEFLAHISPIIRPLALKYFKSILGNRNRRCDFDRKNQILC